MVSIIPLKSTRTQRLHPFPREQKADKESVGTTHQQIWRWRSPFLTLGSKSGDLLYPRLLLADSNDPS